VPINVMHVTLKGHTHYYTFVSVLKFLIIKKIGLFEGSDLKEIVSIT
jgi:hypothetical protein